VKNITKKEILNAIKKGRMYAYRGNIRFPQLILQTFSVFDDETSQKGIMGEEIFSDGHPRIHIRISTSKQEIGNLIRIRLIRNGILLKTFSGETPMEINFQDEYLEPGNEVYYRLEAKDKKERIIVSNPIFVRF